MSVRAPTVLSFLFLSLWSCSSENHSSTHLSKKVIKKIYPSIVEIVVPKKEDASIRYARDLPFDQQDFHIRNDLYHPVGTAFFISPKRLMSAAHVFGLDSFTLWDEFSIRDYWGEVHKVGKVVKYSQYRDFIEFELESYPKSAHFLKLSTQVEVGDMVYAVGNAQGEGISTRGGQVSSFTPEHVNGLWNYIRFSSPTSPGNSGGPLVNSRGEAVGIVVMKNYSENLNFALPIKELKNIHSERAEFFNRGLKIQDRTQMVIQDWKESVALPAHLKSLRSQVLPSKKKFYRHLIEKFKKKYSTQAFPYHPRFRDYLRSQSAPTIVGQVDKDPSLNQWSVHSEQLSTMMIAENQTLYYSKGDIFTHQALIETPQGQTLQQQLEDKEGLIKSILQGVGAHRVVANEKIPILSYGPPQKNQIWRDRLSRVWSSSFWYLSYNNTFVSLHATPTPKGIFCYMDIHWAGVQSDGHMALVKENILELPLSYGGSPKQWKSFLSLPPSYLPTLFTQIQLNYSPQKLKLKLKSPDYSVEIQGLKFNKNSTLTARVGYDPSQVLALKILAWEILENKARQTGALIAQLYEPSGLSSPHHRESWNNMLKKEGFFDGKTQDRGGLYSLKQRLGKPFNLTFWSEKGNQKIASSFVASCFSQRNRGKKWPERICSQIQRHFRPLKRGHFYPFKEK